MKNFILMDEVQLELHDNMSAFTGETGAGKSLLMDAIGILKGDRVNSDMIKEGAVTRLSLKAFLNLHHSTACCSSCRMQAMNVRTAC